MMLKYSDFSSTNNDVKYVRRFLIVSLGSIGKRHLRNIRALRPNSIVGVLRLQESHKYEKLPEGVDEQFFTIDDAISFSPHAAIIASPASFHVPIAMSLVQSGVPILIEKPFSITCKGVDKLIQAAELSGVPVLVGYNLRFLPSLNETKRLISNGVIGDVLGVRAEVGQYLPSWRPDTPYQKTVSARKDLGGGAILELSHEIDYIYWMFGLPDLVSASGGHYSDLEIDVEDMAILCLKYNNPRRLIQIHLDFLQHNAIRECKFIGSEGTLVWNAIEDNICLFERDNKHWVSLDTVKCIDRNKMYLDEMNHFLECIEKSISPIIDAKSAYNVVAIIDAAKKSITNNISVNVNGYNET